MLYRTKRYSFRPVLEKASNFVILFRNCLQVYTICESGVSVKSSPTDFKKARAINIDEIPVG